MHAIARLRHNPVTEPHFEKGCKQAKVSSLPEGPTVQLTGMLMARPEFILLRTRNPKYSSLAFVCSNHVKNTMNRETTTAPFDQKETCMAAQATYIGRNK
jgi:hypothetical protein